jgi:Glycosyl transferase family 2
MQNLAPIVLFTFNRLAQTRQTIEALALNEMAQSSILYIFSDGAKVDASDEKRQQIQAVRHFLNNEVKNSRQFGEIIIVERAENWGLSKSIIEGVTEIVNQYGSVIVLEDDVVTSPYFLKFMNESLAFYKDKNEVLSVGACNYFANDTETGSTVFTAVPDCYGWATWADRWILFEKNGQKLLDDIEKKGLMHRFNLEGAYNFEKMLKNQITGKVSSWAVRWLAVSVLNNKLNLYPNPSLSNHIAGEGATHAAETIKPPLALLPIEIKTIPLSIDPIVHKKVRKTLSRQQSLLTKLKNKWAELIS